MTENRNDCKYEKECNHTGKYDYTYDKIMDYQTNKEYNSFKDICVLLNEQDELIKRLKQGKYVYGIHGGSNDRK